MRMCKEQTLVFAVELKTTNVYTSLSRRTVNYKDRRTAMRFGQYKKAISFNVTTCSIYFATCDLRLCYFMIFFYFY